MAISRLIMEARRNDGGRETERGEGELGEENERWREGKRRRRRKKEWWWTERGKEEERVMVEGEAEIGRE